MPTVLRKWADLTIADGKVLVPADLGLNGGSVQPTTGNRWTWDATAKEPRRTLDAVGGNYVRDDLTVTDTRFGFLRWFYWPGVNPATIKYPMAVRSLDPADSLRAGFAITTAGRLRLVYNTGPTQITTSDFDMTSLPAGWYAFEGQGNILASNGNMKGWLYSADLATTHATLSATGLTFTAIVSMGYWRFGGLVADNGLTEERLRYGIALSSGDALSDNMLRNLYQASVVNPPTLVINRVAENVIDLSDSVAGAGGELSYAITFVSGANNLGSVVQLGTTYVLPRDASTSSTYRVTVTEAGSGKTDFEDVVVAAESSGVVDGIIFERWSGSAWE